VTRRIPASEKQPALSTGGPPVEQFTTKLDVNGKVLAIDTSGVSSIYSQYLNKVILNKNFWASTEPKTFWALNDYCENKIQSIINLQGKQNQSQGSYKTERVDIQWM